MLGKSILQKAGYFDIKEENQKREIFLRIQSIVPNPRENRAKNAIAINFETQKREFTFEWDKEITPGNRDYFFAFSVGAPRDRKKFLSTNNLRSFYKKVFDDSLSYLTDKRDKGETREWFSENIIHDYDKLIQKILDTFYVKEGKDYILNKERLSSDKKESLLKIEERLREKQKSSKPIPVEILYNTLINKEFLGKEGKSEDEFPPVILAKIDGKSILEYKNLKPSYINLVYYDLFERFFIENAQKNKICHICAQKKEVIGEIPLQMKFYGTTNYLYFENLKNQVAYRSFSICRECLKEVLTGMRYTSNELRDWILGISCYLVPSMETEEENFEKKYKSIFKLLNKSGGYQKDIEEIERLLRRSARKKFYFNLLFFEKNKQEFNIIKLISNIEYKILVSKLKLFHDINKTYQLSLLKNSIGLNDLRFHLFPSKYTHNKSDPALYRKDVLDLLEAFLHGYPVNYYVLIKRFMHIYRLKFHRDNNDALAAFKMVLWLSIFNKIKPLKGVETMEGKAGNTVTEIQNENYRKFIEAHQTIYEKNFHRQGLFLLGIVINSIIYAQRDKSSSFMKKLNFSGIPARRVNRLVGEVQNFYQIYNKDIYEEPGIWGNIMDRLQGIEESSMNPEEIVFYILTGISYANYIGRKKGMEKKEGK
jgi:CRISPR-associated protein Csh1